MYVSCFRDVSRRAVLRLVQGFLLALLVVARDGRSLCAENGNQVLCCSRGSQYCLSRATMGAMGAALLG